MKIGFDVDGVLADFYRPYERLIVGISGENRFPALTDAGPAVWDWPQFHGYPEDIVSEAWRRIKKQSGFWRSFLPLPGMTELKREWDDLYFDHDIYFVTARVGPAAKTETEFWLEEGGIQRPTVLITPDKGVVAKALGLDYYIDDKHESVVDVVQQSPGTKAFLLEKAYNQQFVKSRAETQTYPYADPAGLIRVSSVGEFIARIQARN